MSDPVEIQLNPMPMLRAKAETQLNEAFNALASSSAHIDQEYTLKHRIAADVIANGEDVAPHEFRQEATMMGISVLDLAKEVAQKPDVVLARGLQRRADVLAIRNAKRASEIDAILQKYPKRGLAE